MKKIYSAIIFSAAALVAGSASSKEYIAYATTSQDDVRLNAEDRIISGNRKYMLLMQYDGNLVVYRNSDRKILWSSNSENKGGTYALLQRDHNLVIYTNDRTPIWSSGTNKDVFDPTTTIRLEDNGRLELSAVTRPSFWATSSDNGCASGVQIRFFNVCINRMNQSVPACNYDEASNYAHQYGGTYGYCR